MDNYILQIPFQQIQFLLINLNNYINQINSIIIDINNIFNQINNNTFLNQKNINNLPNFNNDLNSNLNMNLQKEIMNNINNNKNYNINNIKNNISNNNMNMNNFLIKKSIFLTFIFEKYNKQIFINVNEEDKFEEVICKLEDKYNWLVPIEDKSYYYRDIKIEDFTKNVRDLNIVDNSKILIKI